MGTAKEIKEQEKTIPSSAEGKDTVLDYQEVRQDFRIYPGEDGLKYQDLKLLGMGGMGIVYSGEDPTLERRVAIKILREPYRNDRNQIAKFINEARITARIDHPNIVSVHQLGINANQGVYFSMRQIKGETLQSVIRHLQEGDKDTLEYYTRRRLLDIFIAGCNGVAAAHEKKILHCDLKPSNIMIGKFGEVLVLDWGLARNFDDKDGGHPGKISGTPAYMAPELLSGEQRFPDEKSEVYALGTILFSILTWNAAPFDLSQDNDKIIVKVLAGKYLPLHAPAGQHFSRELAAICRKAMHHDREQRYATVTELLNDLYNFRDGRAVKAYSPNCIYRFFKLCLRHPAIPIAVLVASFTLCCYSGVGNIYGYIQDRSLLRSSKMNLEIADRFYRKSVLQNQELNNAENLDDPVKIAINERNMILQANLTMMEFFSVLDSCIGLSDAGKREFAGLHAARIFKCIINLQLMCGDSDKMQEVLSRCRRWDFFEEACAGDSVLAEQVRQIENRAGRITFLADDEKLRNCKLLNDKNEIQPLEIRESCSLELPAGDYSLLSDDGIKMRFRIIPACNEYITIPAVLPENNGVVIPGDHFFFEIPGSGSIGCNLSAFVIYKYPAGIGRLFSKEHADEVINTLNNDQIKWRLPRAIEVLKAFSADNFYGVEKNSAPILLHNGDLFDPVNKQIIKNDNSGKPGELFLVRDL